jgi:type-F conjugative transfer system pilin assembly protein TrbC
MTNKLICIAALLITTNATAAQPLPSDEEMLKQGRASIGKVGDLDALFNKAQRNSAIQMQPIEVPKESMPNEYQSPLMKDLAKDAFNTDIRKEIAKDATKKTGSDLIVFVSFSMPDDLLASYSAQAKEAGATLVLRGMVEQSVNKTQLRAIPLNKPLASWDINPGLFRKFNIRHVPAIVLADSKDSQVMEEGCARPSAYIEVDGDVSIRQALLLMRSRGDGGLARDAGKRLEKLER